MAKTSPLPKSRAKTAYGLLSEIRRLILAEPKRYDQTEVLERRTAGHDAPLRGWPDCGTVGCVAGWAVTLKRPRTREGYRLEAAMRLLGLSTGQADELFAGRSFAAHTQTAAHARAGARHIATFQRTYAAQLKAKRV